MPKFVRCPSCKKRTQATYGPESCCRDCFRVAPVAPRLEQPNVERTTPCVQCGQPFEKKHRTNASDTCSDACRERYRYSCLRGLSPTSLASCAHCGGGFKPNRLGQAFCCARCRNAHRRMPCPECGARMSLHAARCRDCRPPRTPPPPCPDCGGRKAATSTVCSACRPKRQTVRSQDDHRATRAVRERTAPGITRHSRGALLTKWVRQGRTCIYCDHPATTIDHVVPLVRGGTNYEGNLAPACKSCNSRKGGRTVIEWRAGKRLSRMTIVPDWKPVPRKPSKPKHVRPWRECSVCGTQCRNLTCSKSCADERSARRNRDAYRIRVGLPVNPSEPTRSLKRPSIRRQIAA